MKTIHEIKNHIPIYTWMGLDSPDEWETLEQTKKAAILPWAFHHIALMADGHIGVGSTVGSVIAMKDAVSPATVGVDIGCVDKDTEYLSRTGWKKIFEYNGVDEVLQFNIKTNLATFIRPDSYIKQPCKFFYHLKTKYGIDQMLSSEHRVLFWSRNNYYNTILAEELFSNHINTVQGFKRGRIPTSFTLEQSTKLNLSDEIIKVMIMVWRGTNE